MGIVIRANSPKEEYFKLQQTIDRLEFYTKHNYYIVLCDEETLQRLQEIESQEDRYRYFVKHEYNKNYFQSQLTYLNSKINILEECIQQLKQYNELWGFEIFDKYTVRLTKYGTGGSYIHQNGTVIMRIARNKKLDYFKEKQIEDTIIHEIVHIGIEDIIVNKYGLSHWEKERVVDLFMTYQFANEFPKYVTQDIVEVPEIDKYITSVESLMKLPEVIGEFRKC